MTHVLALGKHMLVIYCRGDHWAVALDGRLLPARYPSREVAWEGARAELDPAAGRNEPSDVANPG